LIYCLLDNLRQELRYGLPGKAGKERNPHRTPERQRCADLAARQGRREISS
jgi:hypothetical protein